MNKNKIGNSLRNLAAGLAPALTLVIIGILLMTLSAYKVSVPAEKITANDSLSRESEYIRNTEESLREMLKNISGAGECRVSISLSSNGKTEYVREDSEVLVVTDRDGNQQPVIARETAPEIAGVTVISPGAGSVTVRRRIIESVSTVLGIGTNKICVVAMNER